MKTFCKTVAKYITGGNAALEKFAEEARLGLAREEPLTPDTKRDGRGHDYIGGAFRNPLKSFSDEFLAENASPIHEIWTVHQRNTGALNYGSVLGSLQARGGKSYQEAVAEYTDMENRYNYWFKACREKPRSACINVFGRGMNFKWASMEMMIDRGSVKKLCILGIDTYKRAQREFR